MGPIGFSRNLKYVQWDKYEHNLIYFFKKRKKTKKVKKELASKNKHSKI